MGFNNGYEAGYSDCEADNRKKWETEAVERYKAENPPSGGTSAPSGVTGFPYILKAGMSNRVGELSSVYSGGFDSFGYPEDFVQAIDVTVTQKDTHSYDVNFSDTGYPDGQLFIIYGASTDENVQLSITINGHECEVTTGSYYSYMIWFKKQNGSWNLLYLADAA